METGGTSLLDKKAIETLSVNAVKNSIVASDFLDQFITDNDKEPSWDGFVYIYGSKSKKKSNLKGRMPVQVKGKECNDHSKLEITYSMSKGERKEIILNTALDFCEWISEASGNELDYQTKTLNKLQTIRRMREFTIDELKELYTMVEDKQAREDCLVGAICC